MKLRDFARRRPLAALVAVVATVGAIGFVWTSQSSAFAACPLPGNFEIDGDMAQGTCTPSGDDWNTPGLGVATTTQGGTYATSGKDNGNPTGWSSSGSTPNKTNFSRVYGFSRVVGGHYYTYIAWERTGSTGTQGYAIEIDNSPPRLGPNNTPQPDRSQGGVVVYISSQGSSAPSFDGACTFTSQATYGTTCTTSNGAITAAINSVAITDTIAGGSQGAGTFFEVAIDVTALTGIVPSCPGETAASGYIRSITGQTSNGNLKGYMAPLTLQPDSTCVAPDMSTTATPGGALNPPGATQHDAGTVGGGANPAGVGTLQFYLCSPTDVTNNLGDCHTGGTAVGTPVTLVNGAANSPDVTGATTPNDNATGTYCWRSEFTPSPNDHNYLPGMHFNSDTECFTVVHGTPSITTQIAVTGASPPGLGLTTLGDTAQLSGFVGSVTGESITFTLYGPFAANVTPACTVGNVAATATGTLDATGHASTSTTFTPTLAGKYIWIASYGGDTLNDPIAGTCTDSNESETVVGAQIDVAKSANPVGPVSAGTAIGFDITVSNSGSVPALGVHVSDPLPSGANNVSGGDLNWTISPAYTGCSITGAVGAQSLSCNLGTVDGPGSLPLIHISSPTTQADCGTVNNKASVSTTNGTGGDSDVASVVVQCASLSLTKAADAAAVSAGSQIGFTVTASNSGSGTATGVHVSDPLPGGSGVTWSIDGAGTSGPLTCSITGTAPSQSLTCTGTLGAGASEVVHVVSSTTAESCKTYPNEASLTATNVTGTLTADASTTVNCPDLTITKTPDAATVSAGDGIGFTITVSNSSAVGTGTATGVMISDPLPGGSGVNWSVASGGPAGCTVTGTAPSQTLNCTAVSLAPGASESVHVISATQFASCKSYPNTATASATNHASVMDSATTTVQCPAVTITKTADAALVNAGDQIGFVVTVANSSATGTGQAHAVVVDDPLPSGTGIDWSITGSAGNCSIQGSAPTQTLHCAYDTLDAGAGFTVHVISSTEFQSCQAYPNDATLSGSNFPTAHGTASTTVQCPTLTIGKTADNAVVNAGDQIGFTITAHNAGPGVATGASINDPLPGGSVIDWSIDPAYAGPGTCAITGSAPQTLSCDLGSFGVGATATVHVVSGTEFASCATYTNTAALTAGNAPEVDSLEASTTVDCPAPNLTKTADADTVSAGEPIGFTVTASNGDAEGTGVAKGVVIDDPLPFGTGLSWSIDAGPENCSISTDPTTLHQTLDCTAVDLAPGTAEVVHVTSTTAFASCGDYTNVASMTLANGPLTPPVVTVTAVHATAVGDPVVYTASASVTVNCPALAVTKVADAAAVDTGENIGFTIHASNAGPGTAFAAVIQDALPAHPGAHWTVSPAYTGPGTCSIAGADGAQVLTCALGDLAAGADATVHVSATTTADSCGDYDNTVDLASGNAPTVGASATTTVNCAGALPETSSAPPPLAVTGAGPVDSEFGWAFGLIVAGLVLTFLGRRRRLGREH